MQSNKMLGGSNMKMIVKNDNTDYIQRIIKINQLIKEGKENEAIKIILKNIKS